MSDDLGRNLHKIGLLAEFPIQRSLCNMASLILNDAISKKKLINIFKEFKNSDIEDACESLGYSFTISKCLNTFVNLHEEHSKDEKIQIDIFNSFLNVLICQHLKITKFLMRKFNLNSNNSICDNLMCDSIYCQGDCLKTLGYKVGL